MRKGDVQKWKFNIRKMNHGLEKLNELQAIQYNIFICIINGVRIKGFLSVGLGHLGRALLIF